MKRKPPRRTYPQTGLGKARQRFVFGPPFLLHPLYAANSCFQAVARWTVPDLSRKIRDLKEARETRNAAIKNFKLRVFAEFDKDRDVWLRAVRTLAELDCLFSLAKSSLAIGEPACRPEFVDGDGECAFLDFEELRHPTMCLRSDNFIPNDVKLGGDVARVALLTGT